METDKLKLFINKKIQIYITCDCDNDFNMAANMLKIFTSQKI